MPQKTTIGDALAWAAASLQSAGIHPAEREARWLMEYVLRKDSVLFLTNPTRELEPGDVEVFTELVNKRRERYPLQYLLCEIDFANVRLTVTPDVLIPRPETEQLAELATASVGDRSGVVNCADLGTGSGCLAIAIAVELPQTRWWACDVSEAALAVARENADRNGVRDRITFVSGHWFDAVPSNVLFDLVVTNPPYVPKQTDVAPEILYEPHGALFAGSDGLDAYRQILPSLISRLKPNGVFIGEIGSDQKDILKKIAQENGFHTPRFSDDLSTRPRFIVLRLEGNGTNAKSAPRKPSAAA